MGESNADNTIPADIAGLRARLGAVLADIGDDSVARWLGPARTLIGDRARVVVTGEIQAGKTSLINALLNRPDALPVNADGTAGGSYTAVNHGAPQRLVVELADGTITDDGRVATGSADAIRAELVVDEPRLSGLTVLDTPGIGDPRSARGRVILDALDGATGLIFVCRAGSKISTFERDFLAQAARRVDRIIFVLSRIDQCPEWRASLRENEETVRGDHQRFPGGRFADISFLPVSAKKALRQAQRGRSGIDDLWSQLVAISRSRARLATLNELRMIRSATSDAHRLLGERLQALKTSAATGAAAVDDRLTALAALDKAWRGALNSEVSAAKGAVHGLLQLRMMELRNDYQAMMANPTKQTIARVETGLVADLSTMQLRAHADVREHTAEVARRLMAGTPGAEAVVEAIDAALPDPERSLSSYLSQRPPAPTSPAERLTTLQTTFMGWSMSSGAAGAAMATFGVINPIAAALIGIPGAAAWRYWSKHVREQVADASHTQVWVRDVVGQAGAIIDNEVNTAFAGATRQLQEGIDQAFQAARAQLDEARQTQARGLAAVEAEKRKLVDLQRQLVLVGRGCEKQAAPLTAAAPAGEAPTP